ncbi:Coronin-7 [Balamuthia mandrillaris]
MAFKRSASKYRHVKGTTAKKELWYYDIQQGPDTTEMCPLAASADYVAVSWRATGGGSVALLPLRDGAGKRSGATAVPPLIPSCHSTPVSDLQFSPFAENVLLTAAEDGSLKEWSLPQEPSLSQEALSAGVQARVTLSGHGKKVAAARYNPTALGVVASASLDKSLRVWDVARATATTALTAFKDGLYALDWSYDGRLLAVTSKDKKLHIVDPRDGSAAVQEGIGHEGVKPSYVTWLGDSPLLLTTGFSKLRERQYRLWDSRKGLSTSLSSNTLDSSTGVLVPIYDEDTQLLFLAGKGDGVVRCFEVNTEATNAAGYFTELTPVVNDQPTKGICRVPKRALDVMECEVDRLLRLTPSDIVPVTFEVPRKSHRTFADDLFPKTASTEPALTAEAWFGGETSKPKLMSLDPMYRRSGSSSSSSSEASSSSSGAAASSSASSASSSAGSSSAASSYSAGSSSPAVNRSPSPRANDGEEEEEEGGQYYVPKTINIVRSSKFRHLAGQPEEKRFWHTNLKVQNTGTDATIIRANPTYFAVPWLGTGGQVAVIPLDRPGKLPDNIGTIETGAEVLDYDFHPYKDDMLVTATDDTKVRLWQIPEGLMDQKTNHRDDIGCLRGHTRRVHNIYFHPLCAEVLATAAMDLDIKLWDLNTQQAKITLSGHQEQIQSVVFSYEGDIMATSCKDKLVRLWDPRNNKQTGQTEGHQAPKASRLAWLGNSTRLFSSGFNKNSERELFIWDTRNFSTPLTSQTIGVGSGLLDPLYEEDLGVMFLVAVGDSSIKFFEIVDEAPYAHYLTQYQSPTQQAGLARLPKQCCDVRRVEVAKFLKLSGTTVEKFAIKVPRTKTEFFQDDLFPPTRKQTSFLSSGEWFSGKNAKPQYESLQPADMTPLSDAPKVVRKVKKFNPDDIKPDAYDLKDMVVNKFHEKMMEYKEGATQPLPQDLNEGVDEDEWSD